MYHTNSNVSLMIEYVTLIKSGITINVGVRAKIEKNMCEENA